MRVDVAAAQEDGRAGKRARVVTWRAVRSDQAAAEADYAAIPAAVTGRILQRQASPLGEAQKHHALRREDAVAEAVEQPVERSQGRRQPRLVTTDRRCERVG